MNPKDIFEAPKYKAYVEHNDKLMSLTSDSYFDAVKLGGLTSTMTAHILKVQPTNVDKVAGVEFKRTDELDRRTTKLFIPQTVYIAAVRKMLETTICPELNIAILNQVANTNKITTEVKDLISILRDSTIHDRRCLSLGAIYLYQFANMKCFEGDFSELKSKDVVTMIAKHHLCGGASTALLCFMLVRTLSECTSDHYVESPSNKTQQRPPADLADSIDLYSLDNLSPPKAKSISSIPEISTGDIETPDF